MRVPLVPVTMAVARALRTRVRIHIVAGNDVHAHIGRRPTHVVALASRHRHRCLAAAIVEQIDVGIAKVSIGAAIDDVVEARLAQPNPGGVVEHPIGHTGRGVVGEHDAKREPEGDEDEEAVEIGARQRQVPRVVEARLEVGRSHESLHVDDDANVAVEGEHEREENQHGHDGHVVGLHVGHGPGAIVKVRLEGELKGGGEAAHEPGGEHEYGDFAFVEERRDVLWCAQSQIVFHRGELYEI